MTKSRASATRLQAVDQRLRRAQCEALERRVLFSEVTGGTLRLEATNGDDTLSVSLNSTGDGFIVVDAEGTEFHDLDGVTLISVDALGGFDSVIIQSNISIKCNVYGGTGGDTIETGAGDDYIHGGQGADNLFGGAGNDSISGNEDADTIKGGDGGDTVLDGGGEADVIYGNAPNVLPNAAAYGGDDDVIWGGSGNDTILGQNGG